MFNDFPTGKNKVVPLSFIVLFLTPLATNTSSLSSEIDKAGPCPLQNQRLYASKARRNWPCAVRADGEAMMRS